MLIGLSHNSLQKVVGSQQGFRVIPGMERRQQDQDGRENNGKAACRSQAQTSPVTKEHACTAVPSPQYSAQVHANSEHSMRVKD